MIFRKKREKEGTHQKGALREWIDALFFAVIVATFVRWIFMEAFTIPTPSMENSLLVGDFLFVNKMSYGPRTPQTPLQVPLTHAKIWGTDIPSYTDIIQLPAFRLPGFGKVERNNVVVFNYPPESDLPVDLKTHYIKRCVGIPGDVVEVKAGELYINGGLAEQPAKLQFRYLVSTDLTVNDRVFYSLGIWEYAQVSGGYLLHTTPEAAESIASLDYITKVELATTPQTQVNKRIFPNASYFPWNADFFGPLQIPAEGQKIVLNEENLAKYGSTIRDYEPLKAVDLKEDGLWIDGVAVTEYTFQQDYYFMMGDNRHNSEDSRFWGFVPENHVVGEASFIWMSLDRNKSLFSKIRWGRLFNGIK